MDYYLQNGYPPLYRRKFKQNTVNYQLDLYIQDIGYIWRTPLMSINWTKIWDMQQCPDKFWVAAVNQMKIWLIATNFMHIQIL